MDFRFCPKCGKKVQGVSLLCSCGYSAAEKEERLELLKTQKEENKELLQKRLAEVKELLGQGIITREEHDKRRELLLDKFFEMDEKLSDEIFKAARHDLQRPAGQSVPGPGKGHAGAKPDVSNAVKELPDKKSSKGVWLQRSISKAMDAGLSPLSLKTVITIAVFSIIVITGIIIILMSGSHTSTSTPPLLPDYTASAPRPPSATTETPQSRQQKNAAVACTDDIVAAATSAAEEHARTGLRNIRTVRSATVAITAGGNYAILSTTGCSGCTINSATGVVSGCVGN